MHRENDKIKILEGLISSFEPECPKYIDRDSIYTYLCVTDDDKEEKYANVSAEYKKLVHFSKSQKFLKFVETKITYKPVLPTGNSKEPEKREPGPGCLSRLLPFLQKKKKPQCDDAKAPIGDPHPDTAIDCIIRIKEQLDLKSAYATFKSDVDTIERRYSTEKEECDNFKLTDHTNHYFHLMNIAKLKESQSSNITARLENVISDWKTEYDEPSKSTLVSLLQKESAKYTSQNFSFIDWEHPFPFIENISNNDDMAHICNELQKKAAPFVNYNLDSDLKENTVNRFLFSDRPTFEDEYLKIRPKLQYGNEISASRSVHIASKLLMLQILPLDQNMLDHLVDLQENTNETISEILKSIASTAGTKNGMMSGSEEIIDWGDDH